MRRHEEALRFSLERGAIEELRPLAVFLGPSLNQREAKSLLDADYYAPARKGDIYRILPSSVQTIVLIDGVFHSTPTVWQRELLYAIRQGVRVIGASSMGALRAAELHTLGMIGRGMVFEWYRDGRIDGDDEVALLHGSEETDYRPLSEPLVNIRCTLLNAVRDDELSARDAERLLAHAKQLFYADRSFSRLLCSSVLKSWSPARIAKLQRYFSERRVDVKRCDAIDALRFAAGLAQRGKAKRPLRQFKEEPWAKHARLLSTTFIGSKVVSGAEVLAAARKNRRLIQQMRAALARRCFIIEWITQNEVTAPKGFQTRFAAHWGTQHRANDGATWLAANGLTSSSYWELLAERGDVEWVLQKGPAHFGITQSFISEWARQNGVSFASRHSLRRRARETRFEDWIVKQGPRYFGLDWIFEVALLEELQLTGRAATFAHVIS